MRPGCEVRHSIAEVGDQQVKKEMVSLRLEARGVELPQP
jgi:hypothetical protein